MDKELIQIVIDELFGALEEELQGRRLGLLVVRILHRISTKLADRLIAKADLGNAAAAKLRRLVQERATSLEQRFVPLKVKPKGKRKPKRKSA